MKYLAAFSLLLATAPSSLARPLSASHIIGSDKLQYYAIRLVSPHDGSSLGVISLPASNLEGNDSGDLVSYASDITKALKFGFPRAQADPLIPFEITPFREPGRGSVISSLLSVMGEHDLAPGYPHFAGLGMAHTDPDGFLSLDLPLDLSYDYMVEDPVFDHHSETLLAQAGGQDSLHNNQPFSSSDSHFDEFTGSEDELLSEPCGMPQSAIWSFEPSSKKLFARYVNSDGRSVPTKFVTGGGCQHFICLVADVHAFQDVFGEEASEVDLMATALGKLTE